MASFLKVINLFNNTRTTTNTSYTSIADREPVWYYDSADYDGVNFVKLHASFRAASGDTAAMIVSDLASNNINASEITTTSTVNVDVVSGDFYADLTTATDYRVRFKRAAGSGTESFDKANIIFKQTNPTKTVTIIELGEDNNVPSTSYSAPADYGIFKYDSAMFDGTVSIFLEADLHCNASGNTAYSALYDITGATQVASSEVSHTGNTNTTRKRSSAITLTDGNEYRPDIKGSTTSEDVQAVKIIIKQTGTINKTATYIPMVNSPSSGTETSYTAQNRYFTFNASDFDATTKNFYHEATFKVTANTGYARLYNDTDTTELDVRSTTSTSYTRSRSTALTMPTDDSNALNNYRKIDTSGTVTHGRTFLIVELDWTSTTVNHNSLLLLGVG